MVLSPARRHALLDWARRGGGYVIEDDYALTVAFARHAPQVQLTGLAAGFHAVAPLPPSANELA